MGINLAMVMGRVVRDPELKYSPDGIPVCVFTLVTKREFTKPDGSKGELNVFVEVVAWRRLAEICAQFLKKGREAFVSGELQSKKSGNSALRVTANTVQFLGTPKEAEA
jgi:single-strand DNA-binding protein